jgi:SHS2 domain-containing protein
MREKDWESFSMKPYELIDHTADMGIKAHGSSLSEAFANAGRGMFDIITDSSKIESKTEYDIHLSADSLDQLLVDWLSELLFLQGAKNLVFGEFIVTIDEKRCLLSAVVRGEEFKREKHNVGIEIKAVTYHLLKVHSVKPIFVQVLFDI